ncbi:Phospholipase D2 (PLD 2) (mPLD2) (Choline phosphatase 2) (PLD1C) (Phosphatidylcholine-hydrolyzing phospholipase D2), partial [Durusdinium trenchii]
LDADEVERIVRAAFDDVENGGNGADGALMDPVLAEFVELSRFSLREDLNAQGKLLEGFFRKAPVAVTDEVQFANFWVAAEVAVFVSAVVLGALTASVLPYLGGCAVLLAMLLAHVFLLRPREPNRAMIIPCLVIPAVGPFVVALYFLFDTCVRDTYKRRWFVVRPGFLAYFESNYSDPDKPKGVIFLDGNTTVTRTWWNPRFVRITTKDESLAILAPSLHRRRQLQKAVEQCAARPTRVGGTSSRAQWYADAEFLFRDMFEAMERAKHRIFVAGWMISPELRLMRGPAWAHVDTSLQAVLGRAVDRGVKVRVLLYRDVEFVLPNNSRHAKAALTSRGVQVLRHAATGRAIGAQSHLVPGLGAGDTWWSHHEKVVVVDDVMAFVGGIDLAFGRFDSNEHALFDLEGTVWPGKDFYNVRIKEFETLEDPKTDLIDRAEFGRMPWHDVHCAVGGVNSAASEVAAHFMQRWNRELRQLSSFRTSQKSSFDFVLPADFADVDNSLTESLLPYLVSSTSMVRSVGPWSLSTSAESSIQASYQALIRGARRSLYVENQFFCSQRVGDEIAERIERAIAEGAAFRVVIVLPQWPAFEGLPCDNPSTRSVLEVQHRVIDAVVRRVRHALRGKSALLDDFISFYSLRKAAVHPLTGKLISEQVYVHSKLIIADDECCLIGSANLNKRSLQGSRDSEVCVIIRDSRFAKDLRVALVAEHLGMHPQSCPGCRMCSQDRRSRDSEIACSSPEQLEDPASPLLSQIAHENASILAGLFPGLQPTNASTTIDELRENLASGAHDRPAAPSRHQLEQLAALRGHLVAMPLQFLRREASLAPSLREAPSSFVLPRATFERVGAAGTLRHERRAAAGQAPDAAGEARGFRRGSGPWSPAPVRKLKDKKRKQKERKKKMKKKKEKKRREKDLRRREQDRALRHRRRRRRPSMDVHQAQAMLLRNEMLSQQKQMVDILGDLDLQLHEQVDRHTKEQFERRMEERMKTQNELLVERILNRVQPTVFAEPSRIFSDAGARAVDMRNAVPTSPSRPVGLARPVVGVNSVGVPVAPTTTPSLKTTAASSAEAPKTTTKPQSPGADVSRSGGSETGAVASLAHAAKGEYFSQDEGKTIWEKLLDDDTDLLRMPDDDDDEAKLQEEKDVAGSADKERQKVKTLRVEVYGNGKPLYRWRREGVENPPKEQVLKGKGNFRGIAYAIIALKRMDLLSTETKRGLVKDDEREMRKAIMWIQDKSRTWLVQVLSLPLVDLMTKTDIVLDPRVLRSGKAGRVALSWLGRSKKNKTHPDPAAEVKAGAPSSEGPLLALRLKVRVRGILELLLKATEEGKPKMPDSVCSFLQRLANDGSLLPKQFLFPMEQEELEFSKLGYTRWMIRPVKVEEQAPPAEDDTTDSGVSLPKPRFDLTRPKLMVGSFLFLRCLLPVLLRPWEAGVGRKPSKGVLSNLACVATLWYQLCQSHMGGPMPGEGPPIETGGSSAGPPESDEVQQHQTQQQQQTQQTRPLEDNRDGKKARFGLFGKRKAKVTAEPATGKDSASATMEAKPDDAKSLDDKVKDADGVKDSKARITADVDVADEQNEQNYVSIYDLTAPLVDDRSLLEIASRYEFEAELQRLFECCVCSLLLRALESSEETSKELLEQLRQECSALKKTESGNRVILAKRKAELQERLVQIQQKKEEEERIAAASAPLNPGNTAQGADDGDLVEEEEDAESEGGGQGSDDAEDDEVEDDDGSLASMSSADSANEEEDDDEDEEVEEELEEELEEEVEDEEEQKDEEDVDNEDAAEGEGAHIRDVEEDADDGDVKEKDNANDAKEREK